jgi:Tfp pilus assembly protein PilO
MKKTKLPPQAIALIAVFAILFVGALGYFVLVSPQKSKAATLKKEIASTQQQLSDAQNQRAAARKIEHPRYADLYRLSKAMPDSADMAGVLLELSQEADDTGIVFDSITPQTSVPQQGFQVLPVQLVFRGNFYGLSDLIYRLRNLVTVRNQQLEASGRLFSVDSIAFAEAPSGFPQIQATLTIDAFVYGTGPAVAGTATTPATGTTSTDTTATTTGAATTAPAATTPTPTTAGATS